MAKNLAAVIYQMEYYHIRNSRNFVAWVYDKDKPRDLGAADPASRYACVDMLGPFKTLDSAIRACHAHGIEERLERITT